MCTKVGAVILAINALCPVHRKAELHPEVSSGFEYVLQDGAVTGATGSNTLSASPAIPIGFRPGPGSVS